MPPRCERCAAGDKPVKLKRGYYHYIKYRLHPCTEAGFHAEPGDWAECRPREWVPRRLRRGAPQEKATEVDEGRVPMVQALEEAGMREAQEAEVLGRPKGRSRV